MNKMKMLTINNDPVTRAVQKDIHTQMQAEGVENFYEYVADAIGKDTNTVRKRLRFGDWIFDEIQRIIKKTAGKNLRKLLKSM